MNLATNTMEKLTKMLDNTDAKLKEYGKEPYGVKKLTHVEQRKSIENLTTPELLSMIDQYGVEDVNAWLQKYWKEGNDA